MTGEPRPTWPQRAFVWGQYLIPQRLSSRLMHQLARSRRPWVKDLFIDAFVRRFDVDMSEAAQPDVRAYASFNAFFTRALRADARPLGPTNTLLCPADGYLSQHGEIDAGRVLQAKGRDYSLDELLAGEHRLAASLAGGAFATIYLSPRDYHRVHMPLPGRLRTMIHVPGRRFSVNAVTTRSVPRLFARNERVICLFETPIGPVAIVLVGALFVGSIETRWSGQIDPGARPGLRRWEYPGHQGAVELGRGAELGRFNMGSTVILVAPAGTLTWGPELRAGAMLRVGQPIARLSPSRGALEERAAPPASAPLGGV